ncbi:thiamine-phosphate kinase [Fundidesulfovibrio butyratiphilus]
MSAPFVSEDAFLAAISARFPNVHPRMLLGRGDDCAVLACPQTLAVTTDLFIEDVHFRTDYFLPEEIGYKALAVNVSDAAGMGARPVGFSLGLAGPPDAPAAFWESALDGMARLAAQLDLPLTGGDLNACATVVFSITLWAEKGPGGRFLTRKAAREEDMLFCVGELGLSAAGLWALSEQGREGARRDYPQCALAHLRPRVLVDQGLALAGVPGVRGLMDVSDGLARDLPRFLGSLGADLEFGPEFVHPEVARLAAGTGADPVRLTLVGGEDYALLGVCPPQAFPQVLEAVPEARPLGRVTARPGIRFAGLPLQGAGFDHFSR